MLAHSASSGTALIIIGAVCIGFGIWHIAPGRGV